MAAPSLVLLASEAAQVPGTSVTNICHLRERTGAIREGILQLRTREKGQSSKIQISPWELLHPYELFRSHFQSPKPMRKANANTKDFLS